VTRAKEIAAYAAAFTGPLAGNAVLALLDVMQDEWSITATTVLLTIPVFMFPFAIVQLFSGTISDAYDRRATVSIGLAVYALGSFAGAASPSFEFFMGTRFVQGIGYAFVSPVLVAMISDVAGGSRQGLAMGYYGSSTTAGVAAGPLLAGVLAEFNWRLTFAAIGILALGIMFWILVLYETGLGARGRLSPSVVVAQLRKAARNWNVVALSLTGFMAFFAFIGVISFVSDRLGSDQFDLSPSEIGLAISVSGLTGIVLSPLAGRLVDSKGPRCCVTVGFATFAASTFLLIYADSYEPIVGLLALNGMGSSFVWSALLVMVVKAFPAMKGTSSSMFNSARFLGYALSPLLLSPLFLHSGFSAVIGACSGTCLAALALVMSTDRVLGE